MVTIWASGDHLHPSGESGFAHDDGSARWDVMKLSPDQFAELVREALADIPAPFAEYMQNVVVDVETLPDKEACAAGGVEDPRDLLGLYEGVPLTERTVEDGPRLPDRIVLYRRNIERMGRSRNGIIREIRTTVFHEVGHHFGLDEDELADLGFE